MKRVYIYLLGVLSLLFAITPAQAQSQRLDSLLRVSDAIGAKQRAIVDEMMKNYEEMRACKTNEQVLAKLAERQAMDKRAEKLSAEARRVEEEVRVERARLELIERDDKLVKKHGGNIDALRGTLNGYDWVDLGLPSGTKWATCNVGAQKPHQGGAYFAFGEIKPRKNFNEYTWKHYKYTDKVLGNIGGNPKYDAATANMGEGWQMPSREQWLELQEHCDWNYTIQEGIYGSLYVSRINSNYIFLPCAGYTHDDTGKLVNTKWNGAYWSCESSGTTSAFGLLFNYEVVYAEGGGFTCSAHSVRAVCAATNGTANGALNADGGVK